jgi:penicillin-binding protein 1A
MASFGKTSWWDRLKRRLLAFDSGIDHGLWDFARRLGEGYRSFSTGMDRLHTSGPRKWAIDVASEGLTWGSVGAVVMLMLAIPAFSDTADDNWLKTQDLAVTFLDRYGTEVGRRGIRHDDSVNLEDLPPHLIKAVLATEDRRFFEHFGIDIPGTVRALLVNARANSVVQGGSSISQQLAKNLFLTNERSIQRKIKEAFLAMWLETRLTKNEILKLYLDRAYMGGGAFGVQAASDFYFGKDVKDVTLAEAAMLAGLFKAPTKYAPHINLPAARARANVVLSNMVEAGFLTDGQIFGARRNPAVAVDRRRDATPDYYLDWAFEEVKRLADEGKLGQDRVVTVRTALDMDLQKRTETAIESTLRQYGGDYDVGQAASVVMEPDGATRAMFGGRDYGASQFNRATAGLRQPGSSFKTFVYAAALASGKYRRDMTVTDRATCVGNWCPKNYSGGHSGSMPLSVAMAKSINTIPVQMSIALGRDEFPNHEARAARAGRNKIVAMGRAMGLTSDLNDTPSLPIGSAEVTALDMAAGYAVLANGGYRAQPYAAVEIRNSRGDVIYRHDRDAAPPTQVLSAQVTADMNYLLAQVNEAGTGRRAALPGIRTAGKTGTTNGYKDAWYIGYSGNYVASIWMGNDDSSPTADVTGGFLPAMTWHDIMTYAHTGIELKTIPGLAPMDKPAPQAVAATQKPASGGRAQTFEVLTPERPATLSRRSSLVIVGIEELIRTKTERATAATPSRRADTSRVAPVQTR